MKDFSSFRGSSETTREVSPQLTANQQSPWAAYQTTCPAHKQVDPEFLEWFLGFVEGDGSFIISQDRGKVRLSFIINQKDPILLQRLRTDLGFGRVQPYTQNDTTYMRFVVNDREGIWRLVTLCLGNLHLEKTQARFAVWAQTASTLFQRQLPENLAPLSQCPLNLESPWISGFAQADGGFYAGLRRRPSGEMRVILRFYLDQKDEDKVLHEIQQAIGGGSLLSRLDTKGVSRLSFSSHESLDRIVSYFKRYPCRGLKQVAVSRWVRVYSRMNEVPAYGTRSYERFARLVAGVNLYQRSEIKI